MERYDGYPLATVFVFRARSSDRHQYQLATEANGPTASMTAFITGSAARKCRRAAWISVGVTLLSWPKLISYQDTENRSQGYVS
jgi:hypothetical protein